MVIHYNPVTSSYIETEAFQTSKLTEWSDFYNSTHIDSSSSSSPITSIENGLFLRFSFFKDVISAIRVNSRAKVQSLIADSIFDSCFSEEVGGAIYMDITVGESVLCRICATECFSSHSRNFGVISASTNLLNFSSFCFCPSANQPSGVSGSLSLQNGYQLGNNVNALHNTCKYEAGILFGYQTSPSKLLFFVCADCNCSGARIFYPGQDVFVSMCTVVRCQCKENLINYRKDGELWSCNIVDCQADFAVGSLEGTVKAFELFISNELAINEENVINLRPLSFPILHPHLVLETYKCWNGKLFSLKSVNICKRSEIALLSLLVPLNYLIK